MKKLIVFIFTGFAVSSCSGPSEPNDESHKERQGASNYNGRKISTSGRNLATALTSAGLNADRDIDPERRALRFSVQGMAVMAAAVDCFLSGGRRVQVDIGKLPALIKW